MDRLLTGCRKTMPRDTQEILRPSFSHNLICASEGARWNGSAILISSFGLDGWRYGLRDVSIKVEGTFITRHCSPTDLYCVAGQAGGYLVHPVQQMGCDASLMAYCKCNRWRSRSSSDIFEVPPRWVDIEYSSDGTSHRLVRCVATSWVVPGYSYCWCSTY